MFEAVCKIEGVDGGCVYFRIAELGRSRRQPDLWLRMKKQKCQCSLETVLRRLVIRAMKVRRLPLARSLSIPRPVALRHQWEQQNTGLQRRCQIGG